ncbi:MAG: hypothetical protein JO165_12695 [Candidatus Eremiobacteraeota bacterium]|nr:hypothetical protein [Candidatus Eremiobacteraeota bacterium]
MLHHPGWIIAIFALAALVLLAIGGVRLFQAMRRVNAHLRAIRASSVIADLDMIQLRVSRLQEIPPRLTELSARANAAITMLREALQSAPLGSGAVAIRGATDDIRSLAEELR